MDIMNLIHDICLLKNSINHTPKWKFISRNKLIKKLDEDISEFKNLDIFSASENIISFLISVDKEIVKCIDIDSILYDYSYLTLDMRTGNIITTITYLPTLNSFEVKNVNIAYTIYHNTAASRRINKMWEPLTYKIKEKYIEIIIKIADLL